MAMSGIALTVPALMMMSLRTMGLFPQAKAPKLMVELSCVGFGLYLGLPLSVATFPSLCKVKGSTLEPEFAQHEEVWYNRGK